MIMRLAVLAGVIAVLAIAAPAFVPNLMEMAVSATAPSSAEPVETARAPVARAKPAAKPRSSRWQVTVEANAQGHFFVEAGVGGRRINMMIDTGATSVAINDRTAHRLGIRPPPGAYRLPISTANGIVRAAPVVLPSLTIGRISVRDVEAVVIRGDVLPTNLLGMSFLARLSRFEITGDQLVLSQ